jgi:hypothetical protein
MAEGLDLQQIEYRHHQTRDLFPAASSMPAETLQGWHARIQAWVRHPHAERLSESMCYQVYPSGQAALALRLWDPRAAERADGTRGRPLVSRVIVGPQGVLTPRVAIALCYNGLPADVIGPAPGDVPDGAKLAPVSGVALRALTHDLTPELDKRAGSQQGVQALVAAALADPLVPLGVTLRDTYIQRPLREGVQAPLLWGLVQIAGPLLGRAGRGWSFSTYELPMGEMDPAGLPAIVFRQAQEGQQAPPSRHRKELKVRPFDGTALLPGAPHDSHVELAGWLVAEYQERGGAGLRKFIEGSAGTETSVQMRIARVEEALVKTHSPSPVIVSTGTSSHVDLSSSRRSGPASGDDPRLPVTQVPAGAGGVGGPADAAAPAAPDQASRPPAATSPAKTASLRPVAATPRPAVPAKPESVEQATVFVPTLSGGSTAPPASRLAQDDALPAAGKQGPAGQGGHPQAGAPPGDRYPTDDLSAAFEEHPGVSIAGPTFSGYGTGSVAPAAGYPQDGQYGQNPAARADAGAGSQADQQSMYADPGQTTRFRASDSTHSGYGQPARMDVAQHRKPGTVAPPLPELGQSAGQPVQPPPPSFSGGPPQPGRNQLPVSVMLRRLGDAGQDREKAQEWLAAIQFRASLDDLDDRRECWAIVCSIDWCESVCKALQPFDLAAIFRLVILPDLKPSDAGPLGEWALRAPFSMIGGLLAAAKTDPETAQAVMGLLEPFLALRLIGNTQARNFWDENRIWQAVAAFRPPEGKGARRKFLPFGR